MEKRKKSVNHRRTGMPAMKYAEYLKELVIKIVRASGSRYDSIRIQRRPVTVCVLFYERYMTDEELTVH